MPTKLEEETGPPSGLASGLHPVLGCHTLPPSSRPGHLPTDRRVATRLPAATPPPLAMAADDIILAAKEEAAIPAPVKPMAPRATGKAPTNRAVGREELG